MCGIAGVIDLFGRRTADHAMVARMTASLHHRGPDDDGFLFAPGLGFGHRRLSIVGLTDGRQPIFNEDKTIAVVFNGELFDYPERKIELERKGHVFATHADTELVVHLYEEYGEDVFEKLNGQFAFALVDFTKRTIFLARDRTGICPLNWAKYNDWIYFGSEVKAVLASKQVPVRTDPRGLDHIFTFFALGTRRTMFEGVHSVLPGHYLKIAFRADGKAAEVAERCYWDLDFPDAGDEENPADLNPLIDEFEAKFRRAVEIRLRADVPVVSYLSGGVDSAYVLATAAKIRGEAPPSFTIRIPSAKFDEASKATAAARHTGSLQTIVECGSDVISGAYAQLIRAADSPVLDTSCAALLALSGEVHRQGYKVALTGEGADEAFAGYVWFKLEAMFRRFDSGRFDPGHRLGRALRKLASPQVPWAEIDRIDALSGGPLAQSGLYSYVSMARHRYYSGSFMERLGGHVAYEDLPFDLERMKRWHPLNKSLYFGYKMHLAGLLLNHKGDRVAMANSVETRYPFLDHDVTSFAARIHPSLKLRGTRHDKYLLRQAAARILPREIALRPKAMFRAPLAETFFDNAPPFVRQLMSVESLEKTGYFSVAAVRRDYEKYVAGKASSLRVFSSMGLGGVLATQLWHHLNFGGGLCELAVAAPVSKPVPREVAAEAAWTA